VHPPTEFALRVIKGAKCQTTTGLLTECARALDFPDYFGHNWDALEECLADLEWLPAKGYILLFTDAARVLPDDEAEYETFLEVLRDAGEAWGSGQAGTGTRRPTPFHVLFAVSEQEKSKRARWGMKEINAESTRKPGIRRRAPLKRT
jgi:RNAse (barnase) inhibitor barstar